MNMPRPAPFTPPEIHSALAHLKNWDLVERTPAGSDHPHAELHRTFKFSSFLEAMHFMLAASRFIQIADHHPSWQNTYSKIEVWITTGELKHQISAKDVALAQYLEDLFQEYRESE